MSNIVVASMGQELRVSVEYSLITLMRSESSFAEHVWFDVTKFIASAGAAPAISFSVLRLSSLGAEVISFFQLIETSLFVTLTFGPPFSKLGDLAREMACGHQQYSYGTPGKRSVVVRAQWAWFREAFLTGNSLQDFGG
jgi:hypothetical protein